MTRELWQQAQDMLGPDGDLSGWTDAHSAALRAALAQPAPEPLRLVQATAPREIWLQVSDEDGDTGEPFPIDTEGVTWCQDSVLGCEVPYVRADLASPAAPAQQCSECGNTDTGMALYCVRCIESFSGSQGLFTGPVGALTPADLSPVPAAPPIDNAFVADGCEQFTAAPAPVVPLPTAPEPVAWMDDFGNVFPIGAYKGSGHWLDDHKRTWVPLYAAAPAPAPAAPLTDEQIIALNANEVFFSESPSRFPEAGHGTQYHAGAPGVRAFARAVLAAAPAPVVPAWLPIETAPKDGGKILLAKYGWSNDAGDAVQGSDEWKRRILDQTRRKYGLWWCVSGHWSARWNNWSDGVEPCGLADPTHWMPLPAAPGASPPAPAAAEPLSDEQIDAGIKAWFTTAIAGKNQPFEGRMRAAYAAINGIGIKGDGND